MNAQTRIAAAFHLGFLEGSSEFKPLSPAEVEARHPTLTGEEIACYLNGHDDGLRRDAWRDRQCCPRSS